MKQLFALAVCLMFVSDLFADDWRMRKYDFDKDGMLNKSEAKEFIDRCFKFEDGKEMTDQLFMIIFELIDVENTGKLEKTNVLAFCT